MKKKNYIKNIFYLFLISIILFGNVNNVYASKIDIHNVATEFEKTIVVEGLTSLGTTINANINETNKNFDIYTENEKAFSFTYNDEYIEYDNRNTIVTKENCLEDFFTPIWIESVIQSIFNASGHINKTIYRKGNYTDTYDTYGIQMETESCNFSGTDDDGSTWDYIKYFKISFDTNKIDALVNKYGILADNFEANPETKNLVPTLEAKDITENSVTLYPEVANYDSEDVFCFIYRSNDINGTYEKISSAAVSCSDGIGIIDKNLKSNTTYYYKAIVYGGEKYSDIIKVSTKGNLVVDEGIDEDPTIPENPQTGSFISTISVCGAITLIIGIIYYVKKKNSIYKI